MKKNYGRSCFVLIMLLACGSIFNSLAESAISMTVVKFGIYDITVAPSGDIIDIKINGTPIIKRGAFFVRLTKTSRDAQWNANEQGAKIEVKEESGKKIIINTGELKQGGDNIEYAQKITLDPAGIVDVRLQIRYLLQTIVPIQYELEFASPELVYGQEAEIVTRNGEIKKGVMPSSDFHYSRVEIEYFKAGFNPQKFTVQTTLGQPLIFEFPHAKAGLYLDPTGGLTWIMGSPDTVAPGEVIKLHYRIILPQKGPEIAP